MTEPLVGAPFDAPADESQGDARARPGLPDRRQAGAGEQPVGARVEAVGHDDAAIPGGPFEPADEPAAPWGADLAEGQDGDLALPEGAGSSIVNPTPGVAGASDMDGLPLGADARARPEECDSRALPGAGQAVEGEPVEPFGHGATPDDADPRAHPPGRPVAGGAEPRPFGARGASRDGGDRRVAPPAREGRRLGSG